jgi:hypothetical protein
MKFFETENNDGWIVESNRYQYVDVTLSIVNDRLSLCDISSNLQIQHTDGFERGEIYHGKKTGRNFIRINGVWRYDSKNFVNSDKIRDHIDHILNTFEPKMSILESYLFNKDYRVSLTIWVQEDLCITSIEIDKPTMNRLLNICNVITFTLGSHDQCEDIER